jgi:diguanylate cyclase (GGDEF)-like protein
VNLLEPQGAAFRRFHHDPHSPSSLGHDLVSGFYQDREGTLWIATDGGLSQWVPDNLSFLNYAHDRSNRYSLTDNRVRALFQDAGGVLWIGTFNGISKWNYLSDSFRYFHNGKDGQGPLKHNTVTSIADAGDGSVWLGTYGGGVSRMILATGEATHYVHDPENDASLSSNRVMTVYRDKDGNLWAGTRAAGLNRIDARSGAVRRYQHNPREPGSISSNGITNIFGDADETLWIGTYGGGLNRMDPKSGTFRVFRHDPENELSLSSDRVLAIFRDSSGVLWVGTEAGGLNAFDEDSGLFRRYRHDPARTDSLSNDTAWDLTEGADGSLWIGTNGGGLNRWLPENRSAGRDVFKHYSKRHGLLGGTVQGILEDRDGNIWISSNRGLSQLNPKNGQVRNFDAQNGLIVYDFMQGSHAETENGLLLFGSSEGLVAFSIDRIVSNTHKPQVVVTAYLRMVPVGRALSTDNQTPAINLSYTDYSVTFEFSALDYTSSDKNIYRYRLEGFDKDWIEAGHYRRVTYTNLPAGSFRFQVEGANNDGVWGERSADLSLHVSPPPWRSHWAYTLYTLLVFGSAMAYLRFHKRNIEKEAQYRSELEDQVRHRTHELSERNAELVNLADQLRLASVTDSLTGLKNRRYLDEFIHPEVAQVDRLVRDRGDREPGNPMPDIFPGLFFMMIDLDGFKLINDTHGHNAGDQALLQVCEVLNRCCRSADTVIRMGGDEFLLIGRGSTRSSIEKLAERIRMELAAHRYRLGEHKVGRLSASIGISIYPFFGANSSPIGWERVVAIADQAAYLAKENQRNAWVGIYPGPMVVSMEAFELIGDRLNELVQDGAIEIRTSIQKELTVFSQKRRSVSA